MKPTCQSLELLWLPNSAPPYLSATRPGVPAYRVGEPLLRGRRNWPAGAQYHYAASGHELTLFHPAINETLIQDVKRGDAEFAVIVEHPVLLLAYRFGNTGSTWSDVPYCWHMQPPYARVVPPPEASPESRALLWITLVGAQDGIIYAQRGMTLAPDFTQVLQQAIRAQALAGFHPHKCLQALHDLLVTHPTTADRLPLAKLRTFGNR